MITATVLVTAALAALPPEFPSPYDASGWGLRVRRLGLPGPFLVCESGDAVRVEITLTNKTAEARPYPPLDAALRSTELQFAIRRTDMRDGLQRHLEPDAPTRPKAWRQMPAGKSVSIEFSLKDFGYQKFWDAGKYRTLLVFKSPQGRISACPWIIEVIEPTEDAILVSHTLPPGERQAKRPADAQDRAVVQQIKLADKVYLFYRQFDSTKNRGGVYNTVRLAELPEKCEMQVTGSVGDELITITYKHSPTGTTKLTVGSKTGTFGREVIEK